MTIRQLILLTVIMACAGSILIGQIKVDVELVNIVTTVTDEKGRLVPNLKQEDFIVEEDDQVQTIEHLTPSGDTPISMGVVLDTSGSMVNKIRAAQLAIDRFIRAVHPDDDIFLMTFASRGALIVDFTSDRNRLSSALRAGVSVGGSTVLYDALFQGLQKVKQGKFQKKAVLLVTDGEDTNSSARFDRTLQNIRESEMLVYCVGIRGSDGFDMTPDGGTGRQGSAISSAVLNSVDMKVLSAFSDTSGGKAWEVAGSASAKDIEPVLDRIAAELRGQYSIGYYPNHPIKDGKWHNVRIRVKDPHYYARARKEYLGK